MTKFFRITTLMIWIFSSFIFTVCELQAYSFPIVEKEIQIREKPKPLEVNFITFSRIDKAWKYTKGKGTKVAILDWLFDMNPEASKKYLNPTSLVPGEAIGSDEPGHGEWMAKIVHLVAPEAKIIPIRAKRLKTKEDNPGGKGNRHEPYLIKGIYFAADQGLWLSPIPWDQSNIVINFWQQLIMQKKKELYSSTFIQNILLIPKTNTKKLISSLWIRGSSILDWFRSLDTL